VRQRNRPKSARLLAGRDGEAQGLRPGHWAQNLHAIQHSLMTANITFSDLSISAADGSRLPLDRFAPDTGRIHGRLMIRISGRALPHMAYSQPDDVCLNTWAEELLRVVLQLGAAELARYTFDEGEQGQPAFEFSREGELLYVSVVASVLSGARGDPSFRMVSCLWADFQAAAQRFFADLQAVLREQTPDAADAWWGERVQHAG
jgi:hypothetical protein